MTHPIEFRLVRRADLRQRRLLWLLLICATGLSLAFVLLRAPLPFGFWVGMPIPDRDDRAVSAELAALRAERDALVGRVARAERSAQVEQESSTRSVSVPNRMCGLRPFPHASMRTCSPRKRNSDPALQAATFEHV